MALKHVSNIHIVPVAYRRFSINVLCKNAFSEHKLVVQSYILVCNVYTVLHRTHLSVGFPVPRVFNKTYGGAISNE